MLCPHRRDEDRGFVTTLTHLELNLALEKGYRVIKLYSALVWDRWSPDLFKDYIRDFMKIKVKMPPPSKTIVHLRSRQVAGQIRWGRIH